MNVWYCVPSKRALADSTLGVWRSLGYKVIVARERADGPCDADHVIEVKQYLGWAKSVNMLVGLAMATDPTARWFVTGGDDYLPDLHEPADIARECEEYFRMPTKRSGVFDSATFGVMQPTGDRWGEAACTTCNGRGYYLAGLAVGDGPEATTACRDCHGTGKSAILDRICGSPWMGREFCERINGGRGPLWSEYFHNFADQELHCVAQRLGVLWNRPDLNQHHRHWAREGVNGFDDAPAWARAINDPSQSDWNRSKALFAERKAAGFPGHQPLQLATR